LQLTIQVDGQGIPAGMSSIARNGKTGVGLASMRERATSLGGSFAIQRGMLSACIVPDEDLKLE